MTVPYVESARDQLLPPTQWHGPCHYVGVSKGSATAPTQCMDSAICRVSKGSATAPTQSWCLPYVESARDQLLLQHNHGLCHMESQQGIYLLTAICRVSKGSATASNMAIMVSAICRVSKGSATAPTQSWTLHMAILCRVSKGSVATDSPTQSW